MEETKARFTSDVTLNLPVFQEYQHLFIDSTRKNTALRLVQLYCALVFILFMDRNAYTVAFLVFTAVFIVAEWRAYHKNKDGGLVYKQMLHQADGNIPHNIVSFLEDGILFHNPHTGNDVVERYESIRELRESRNLLLLITDLNLYRVIDKRTLTGGSSQELIAFLRKKCPNLKRRVSTGAMGRFVRRALWIVIALGLVWCLANSLQIPERLSGQLTNHMPAREMAAEFAALDIPISDRALDTILLWESDDTSLFPRYHGNSKALDMLICEGMGEHNYDTWEWTPSTSGVLWFDLEVMNISSMYTDFLTGVDAMDESLSFSNIAEDYSRADLESGKGLVTFSFDYLDQTYTINAQYNYDWFDTDVLRELSKILNSDEDPKDLWYTFDGQGVLLYYGTFAESRTLERKTGLYFLDPVHQPLYGY